MNCVPCDSDHLTLRFTRRTDDTVIHGECSGAIKIVVKWFGCVDNVIRGDQIKSGILRVVTDLGR